MLSEPSVTSPLLPPVLPSRVLAPTAPSISPSPPRLIHTVAHDGLVYSLSLCIHCILAQFPFLFLVLIIVCFSCNLLPHVITSAFDFKSSPSGNFISFFFFLFFLNLLLSVCICLSICSFFISHFLLIPSLVCLFLLFRFLGRRGGGGSFSLQSHLLLQIIIFFSHLLSLLFYSTIFFSFLLFSLSSISCLFLSFL